MLAATRPRPLKAEPLDDKDYDEVIKEANATAAEAEALLHELQGRLQKLQGNVDEALGRDKESKSEKVD